MSKWWMAKAKHENQYAIGSGDVEICIVTGQDDKHAREQAKEILDALRYVEKINKISCQAS